MLLQLSHANPLEDMIYTALLYHGGLSNNQMAEKIICFGVDGAMVFWGFRNGMTQKLVEMVAPYSIGMHAMAHHTILVQCRFSLKFAVGAESEEFVHLIACLFLKLS